MYSVQNTATTHSSCGENVPHTTTWPRATCQRPCPCPWATCQRTPWCKAQAHCYAWVACQPTQGCLTLHHHKLLTSMCRFKDHWNIPHAPKLGLTLSVTERVLRLEHAQQPTTIKTKPRLTCSHTHPTPYHITPSKPFLPPHPPPRPLKVYACLHHKLRCLESTPRVKRNQPRSACSPKAHRPLPS